MANPFKLPQAKAIEESVKAFQGIQDKFEHILECLKVVTANHNEIDTQIKTLATKMDAMQDQFRTLKDDIKAKQDEIIANQEMIKDRFGAN